MKMKTSLRILGTAAFAALLAGGASAANDFRTAGQYAAPWAMVPRSEIVNERALLDLDPDWQPYVRPATAAQRAAANQNLVLNGVFTEKERQRLLNLSRGSNLAPLDRLDITFVTGESAADLGISNAPAIRTAATPDGRFVAFTSLATNLTADDTNGAPQVYRYDRQTGTVIMVSKTGTGAGDNGSGMVTFTGGNPLTHDMWALGISDDGTKISFTSEATNLVAGDTNGVTDVFLWNFNGGTPTVSRMSVDAAGAELVGASYDGVVSGDGNHIAFFSQDAFGRTGGDLRAANAVDVNGDPVQPAAGTTLTAATVSQDIFYRTVASAASLTLVTHATGANNTEANSDSYHLSISGDGSKLAYVSRATNLTADVLPAPFTTTGSTNRYPRSNAFIWERSSNTNYLLSVSNTGAIPAATSTSDDCLFPHITRNGNWVAFQTGKALTPSITATGSTNGVRAVVRNVATLPPTAAAIRRANVNETSTLGFSLGRLDAGPVTVSEDGRVVAFWSYHVTDTNSNIFYANPVPVVKVFDTTTASTSTADQSGQIYELTDDSGDSFFDFDILSSLTKFGDGFWDGPQNRIEVGTSGADTILTFIHAAPNWTGPTRGIQQVYQATIPTASTTGTPTAVALVSEHSTSAPTGADSLGIPTDPHEHFAVNIRPAVSPNGRYIAFPMKGADAIFNLGISNDAAHVLVEGGVYIALADLQTNSLRFVSVDAKTDDAADYQVGGSSFGFTAASTDFFTDGVLRLEGQFLSRTVFLDSWAVSVSDTGRVAFMTIDDVYGPEEANTDLQNVAGNRALMFTGPNGVGAFAALNASGQVHQNDGGGIFFNDATYITPDGRYIGFTSPNNNVHPLSSPSGAVQTAYIYDTVTGVTRLVSNKRNTSNGNADGLPIGSTIMVGLSDTGQRALFGSLADVTGGNADDILNPGGDSADIGQLYIFDDLTDGVPNDGVGQVYLVSSTAAGVKAADADAPAPDFNLTFANFATLTGDGLSILLEGEADTFGNTDEQFWLKSLASGSVNSSGIHTGPLTILSLDTAGAPLTNPTTGSNLNGSNANTNGTVFAFISTADNISTDDIDTQADAFLGRTPVTADSYQLASASSTGVKSPANSSAGARVTTFLNGDAYVYFRGDADNTFVASDNTAIDDIYIKGFLTAPPSEADSWNMYE
ncbi:MAG: hypothetical protein SF028_13405 [Candidatus Sumerlaeia bacterium]|nr:hypothetical protein [Candidatus Sumerlaeia bacterium]